MTRPPRRHGRSCGSPQSCSARAAAGSGSAAAQTKPKFLEPERAFAYSVQAVDDTTVEARFAIAPGYYLYREKMKSRSIRRRSPRCRSCRPAPSRTINSSARWKPTAGNSPSGCRFGRPTRARRSRCAPNRRLRRRRDLLSTAGPADHGNAATTRCRARCAGGRNARQEVLVQLIRKRGLGQPARDVVVARTRQQVSWRMCVHTYTNRVGFE